MDITFTRKFGRQEQRSCLVVEIVDIVLLKFTSDEAAG